jgi:MATE family, multidrug efflux pump
MLINAAAYWGIGLPCAWIFGIALRHDPRAVWAGLVLDVTLAAVLLLRRFYRLPRAR